MLTITPLSGSGVKIVGGGKPVLVFPEKVQADAINLLQSPDETPAAGTVSWPGEYDMAGITIRGVGQLEGQKVSYVCTIDDTRVAALASPLEDWHELEIEKLGDVAVLILPAEDSSKCQKLIDELDPRVLILIPGSDGNVSQEVLKACGAVGKEHVSEHKIKGLPAEGREVVVLA